MTFHYGVHAFMPACNIHLTTPEISRYSANRFIYKNTRKICAKLRERTPIMSAAVKDPRGLKRICLECSSRFYDMNKRPIVCPSCDTEFTGEVKVKSRRGSKAAEDTKSQVIEKKAAATEDDEDELEEEDDGAEIISLDDAESTKATDIDDEDAPAPKGDLDLDPGIGDLDDDETVDGDDDIDLDDVVVDVNDDEELGEPDGEDDIAEGDKA